MYNTHVGTVFTCLALFLRHGGWVVDGFPITRSHWTSMIDANVLPDVVISLENASKDKDILLRRFCRERGLSEPLMEEEDKKKGTEKVV